MFVITPHFYPSTNYLDSFGDLCRRGLRFLWALHHSTTFNPAKKLLQRLHHLNPRKLARIPSSFSEDAIPLGELNVHKYRPRTRRVMEGLAALHALDVSREI